ncbi:MAG: DUF1998 domain-containing protein [Acidobacteria bacterium]|nr:DUF1998 domain-containing protein [Acidobacteriota bacterium]MCI0663556.1 DUF1998 domain-containing protein [Acidobacteriota bacterium]
MNKVGELRPSQMLYNFGVGGVVDLPLMSVLILGIDDWNTTHMRKLPEERLLAAVKRRLGSQVGFMAEAPVLRDMGGPINPYDQQNLPGIPVAPFPGWVICPVCHRLGPLDGSSFKLEHNIFRWQESKFVHETCQYQKDKSRKRPVIPARFIVACEDGHLDDFPWVYFVHDGNTDCQSVLHLSEYGVSGTAADIKVTCKNCGKGKNMAQAFGEAGRAYMPKCRGRHPHLHKFEPDGCDEQMVAMLLGATNLWFPVTFSALAIPSKSGKLRDLVDKHWSYLSQPQDMNTLNVLIITLQHNGQLTDLTDYSIHEIWAEVEKKKSVQQVEEEQPDLKEPEWAVFSDPDPTKNTSDFELTKAAPPKGYDEYFEKVVLINRLREVTALMGFTRILSPADFMETMEEIPTAPISRQSPSWIPSIEVRGEGIFIEFKEDALQKWEDEIVQGDFQRKTAEAHINWRTQRKLDPTVGMPNARMMLIHTFAHAMLQQFAIECGYNVASLRERIYSRLRNEEGGPMAGLLIYTAAPDSEGTLGGLVALGEPSTLSRHIDQALERMRLCASDPLCAEHDPTKVTGTLHWAACHACLFSPETSCEKGNKYLDRALLVPTIKVPNRAYFK